MEVKTIRQRILETGYLELVDAIFDLRPDAVIAGGFVRDLMHGKTIRDIDVLLLDKEGLDEFLGDNVMGSYLALTHDVGYEGMRDGDSKLLKQVWKNPSETIDFLVVEDVMEVIKDFPDDISQVWMVRNEDKSFTVDSLPAYEAAHRDHAIRISKRLLDTRGERRIGKLHAKFQDYNIELRAGE